MKKSLSNLDVRRIAEHAGLSVEQARSALALDGRVDQDTARAVEHSAQALRYTVSLRDRVAMAAGTSVATVNRAYRPEARGTVRPEALAAIDREAARLGYRPDPVARAHRAREHQVVAICPEVRHLTSPYHTALIQALSEVAIERDLHVVIAPAPTNWLLPDIAQSNVTGLVVLWQSERTEQQLAALRAAGRQAMVIGHHPGTASVAPDWTDAYTLLASRALDQDFDVLHLGYLADAGYATATRLEGVARALAAKRGSIPDLRLWLSPGLDLAQISDALGSAGMPAAAAMLTRLGAERGATERRTRRDLDGVVSDLHDETMAYHRAGQRAALLGHSDRVISQVLFRLRERGSGIAIGEGVGVAGHDNLEPMFAERPAVLTTISYNLTEIAGHVLNTVREPSAAPFIPVRADVVLRSSL